MKTKAKEKPKAKVKAKAKAKEKEVISYYPEDIATTIEEVASWRLDITFVRFLLRQEKQLEDIKEVAKEKQKEIPGVVDKKAQVQLDAYNFSVQKYLEEKIKDVALQGKPEKVPVIAEIKQVKKEELVPFIKRVVSRQYGEGADRQAEGVQKIITRNIKEVSYRFDIRMLQDPTWANIDITISHPSKPSLPIVFTGKDLNGYLRQLPRDVRKYSQVWDQAHIKITRFPITRIRKEGDIFVDTYLERMIGEKQMFGTPGWTLALRRVAKLEMEREQNE